MKGKATRGPWGVDQAGGKTKEPPFCAEGLKGGSGGTAEKYFHILLKAPTEWFQILITLSQRLGERRKYRSHEGTQTRKENWSNKRC
jgi:hypothetical protein